MCSVPAGCCRLRLRLPVTMPRPGEGAKSGGAVATSRRVITALPTSSSTGVSSSLMIRAACTLSGSSVKSSAVNSVAEMERIGLELFKGRSVVCPFPCVDVYPLRAHRAALWETVPAVRSLPRRPGAAVWGLRVFSETRGVF